MPGRNRRNTRGGINRETLHENGEPAGNYFRREYAGSGEEALDACLKEMTCCPREECRREAYGLYLNLEQSSGKWMMPS